jgi:hypothetical protein
LYCTLCFDRSYCGIHILHDALFAPVVRSTHLRHHIAAIQQTTSHVFAVSWITFHHLIAGLKTLTRYLADGQLFMIRFLTAEVQLVCGGVSTHADMIGA